MESRSPDIESSLASATLASVTQEKANQHPLQQLLLEVETFVILTK